MRIELSFGKAAALACQLAFLLVLPGLTMLFGQAPDEIDLTRAVIQGERQGLVARFMKFSPEELVKFWPVYLEYRSEMEVLGDRTVALINEYSEKQDRLSDRRAMQMLEEFFKVEESQLKLKKEYLKEFRKVLTPRKAVRFFQLDNKLDAIVNYNLAGSVPLLE